MAACGRWGLEFWQDACRPVHTLHGACPIHQQRPCGAYYTKGYYLWHTRNDTSVTSCQACGKSFEATHGRLNTDPSSSGSKSGWPYMKGTSRRWQHVQGWTPPGSVPWYTHSAVHAIHQLQQRACGTYYTLGKQCQMPSALADPNGIAPLRSQVLWGGQAA